MNSCLMRNRGLAALLTGVALLVAALAYFELRFLGFPDGYLSDWDRARKMLLTGLVVANICVSAGALFFGTRASPVAGRNLKIVVLIYAVLLAAALVADAYLNSQSGRGG